MSSLFLQRYREALQTCNDALDKAQDLVMQFEYHMKTISRALNQISYAYCDVTSEFQAAMFALAGLGMSQTYQDARAELLDRLVHSAKALFRTAEALEDLAKEPKSWPDQLNHWLALLNRSRFELVGAASRLQEQSNACRELGALSV